MRPSRYDDTICAIATGQTHQSAIAIIRVSGADALPIVSQHFKKKLSTSHKALFGIFKDRNGEAIDDVIVLPMKDPHSYTGEDVVEIHCHGGLIQPRRILEELCNSGCRLAEPGEFTRRSVLNGRLSLLQAEAVNHVISATSTVDARAALMNCHGVSTNRFVGIRQAIISILAHVEASLDFPDEDPAIEEKDIEKSLVDLNNQLSKLKGTFKRGQLLRRGPRIVITGDVNVGKSSLFNALLRTERAIVTNIPGTTRDLIEEGLFIDGFSFRLVDTAGLRSSDCPVEQEGIKRAVDTVQQADILIDVRDIRKVRRVIDKDDEQARILVANKVDLVIEENVNTEKDELAISAISGEGLTTLTDKLVEVARLMAGTVNEGEVILFTQRQFDGVCKANLAIDRALKAHLDGLTDVVADETREAAAYIASIIGEVHNEDVLDEMFSTFCLGK